MTETPLPSAALRIAEHRASAASPLRQRAITGNTTGDIHQAIAHAAQRTSVDFDYLLAQAEVESALDPRAKASGSSASGLYQFIESTWLATVKRHGARFGLGDLADQIGWSRSGSAEVSDPAVRAALLKLREDPQIAALMAAALAEDNRAELVPVLGRQPDHGELYLAHFLGASGAARFLSHLQADPAQSAPALFRRPAGANRAIFFEPSGAPRSLAGVMDHLDAKMNRALAISQARALRPEGIAGSFITPTAIGAAPLALPQQFTLPPGQQANLAPFEAGAVAAASFARPFETRLSLPSALPPAAGPAAALPRAESSRAMSSLLAESLEAAGAPSAQGAAQINRAYAQLRVLGL